MVANVNVNTNRGWINNDTLRVKFGAAEWIPGKGGDFRHHTSTNVSQFDVDFADVALGTDGTHAFVLDYDEVLPAGASIEKVEFYVITAWDSASSNVALNFGLIQRSDFTTIIDTDGLMDSVAKTVIDLAGNLVVTQAAGSYPDITTYGGALLGTPLAFDSVVVTYWETNAPTVGEGRLKIYWRYPLA